MDTLESFDNVIKYYQDSIRSNSKTTSIFDRFDNFFEKDLSHIDKWLENQLNNKVLKSNSLSTVHRKQGNVYFSKKNLKQSFEYYTKSLCYALPLSEEYGLALANRSAVTLEMKKYGESLNDINRCLATKYPQELRPKILLRKAECLQKLTNRKKFVEFLEEIQIFFERNPKNNDKFIEKLNSLKNMPITEEESSSEFGLPKLEKGENPNFAYASAKIEMRYDSVRGRHVVAKEPVLRGDILFVEKAYSFGVIFDVKTRNINQNKCYNCLKNVFSGIPCNSCVKCMFCNETCRDLSWNDYHKWECRGMQTDLWYHFGVAFPAMRILLKAHSVIFSGKTKGFDSTASNYECFDSLTYHVCDDEIGTLVCSATVVRYLAEYTDFFNRFLNEGNLPKMLKYVGGVLAKNILQLGNNSSLIEHWIEDEESFPKQKDSIACGIFPSVSIMNHSCKTNITNYFIDDTIVVKALENIQENCEIFNCYGIDYRIMGRDERQKLCLSLYNFKCNCFICSDVKKEMDYFDGFKCQECGLEVPDYISLNVATCEECNARVDLKKLRSINDNIPNENSEAALLTCLHLRETILSPKHSDLQDVYQKLYMFYLENGDYDDFMEYFYKWLINEKIRMGECAYNIAAILYDIGLILRRSFSSRQQLGNIEKNKNSIGIAKNMLRESKQICCLYYPDYLIEKMMFE